MRRKSHLPDILRTYSSIRARQSNQRQAQTVEVASGPRKVHIKYFQRLRAIPIARSTIAPATSTLLYVRRNKSSPVRLVLDLSGSLSRTLRRWIGRAFAARRKHAARVAPQARQASLVPTSALKKEGCFLWAPWSRLLQVRSRKKRKSTPRWGSALSPSSPSLSSSSPSGKKGHLWIGFWSIRSRKKRRDLQTDSFSPTSHKERRAPRGVVLFVRRSEKRANFSGSHPSAPHPSGLHPLGPLLLGLSPTLWAPQPSGPTFPVFGPPTLRALPFGPPTLRPPPTLRATLRAHPTGRTTHTRRQKKKQRKKTEKKNPNNFFSKNKQVFHTTKTLTLAKVGLTKASLTKVGCIMMAKVRLAKVGVDPHKLPGGGHDRL